MENLRKIREKRHKNQLNVALEVGVTQESISMYESGVGYPSATVLIKLAKYLETSTDYLLGLTDDDTPIKYITKNLSAKEVELLENSKINKRTFLNNKDSCEAIIELINSQKALDGTVYNVATDEEISIIDLVYLCAEKLDIKNPKIIFKGYRESDPKRRILNTDKIRKLTEWKPKITLDKGIEECIIELNKQGGK